MSALWWIELKTLNRSTRLLCHSCLIYVPVDVIKERLQVGIAITTMPPRLCMPSLHHNTLILLAQVQRRLLTGQEVSGPLPMYRGTTHAFQSILRQEGIRGIYKVRLQINTGDCCPGFLPQQSPYSSTGGSWFGLQGYGATLFSFGPFSAFYFLFYEKVCKKGQSMRCDSCALRD